MLGGCLMWVVKLGLSAAQGACTRLMTPLLQGASWCLLGYVPSCPA